MIVNSFENEIIEFIEKKKRKKRSCVQLVVTKYRQQTHSALYSTVCTIATYMRVYIFFTMNRIACLISLLFFHFFFCFFPLLCKGLSFKAYNLRSTSNTCPLKRSNARSINDYWNIFTCALHLMNEYIYVYLNDRLNIRRSIDNKLMSS